MGVNIVTSGNDNIVYYLLQGYFYRLILDLNCHTRDICMAVSLTPDDSCEDENSAI